jgi:hypothetical protein
MKTEDKLRMMYGAQPEKPVKSLRQKSRLNAEAAKL